ncbi:MAG: molybdopterin dinucleotide-binding region [Gemmatimonadetes bacterium]|nr:molybdopterin dinucleotide-binding region [Gemmatimonadota bacterium]
MAKEEGIQRPLRVAALIATKRDDPERGPMVVMNPDDARSRLLTDGELAWVYGPKRHELATVRIDPGMRLGDVFLRDITGARPSEIVKVIKPDLDTRARRPTALG